MVDWEVNALRSITSNEATERLRSVFESRGIVFGWQMFFKSTETGTYVLFDSWQEARHAIKSAMAGDRFTLYSSETLPSNSFLGRFDAAGIRTGDGKTNAILEKIRTLLFGGYSEIVYLLRSPGRASQLDYACGPFDELDWADQLKEWKAMSGELWVLDEAKLGRPWVDLWRPDWRGRVPTSGFTVTEKFPSGQR